MAAHDRDASSAQALELHGIHADLSELLEVRRHIELLVETTDLHEGALPAVDLLDIGHAWQIRCEVPGVELNDLELAMRGDQLFIAGVRTPIEEGVQVLMRERSDGVFERHIELPGAVRVAEVTAHLRSGLLIIDLPKAHDDCDDG